MKINRLYVIITAIAALLLAVPGVLLYQLTKDRRQLVSITETNAAIETERETFIRLSARVRASEARAKMTGNAGIVQAVDAMMSPLGLKAKLKSLKPLPQAEPREERAEIMMQALTMNELINALYAIDTHTGLAIVRKAEIKPSFDYPELVNLTLTLSMIRQ